MNCKKGDLAVVVRSRMGEAIGKICTVISASSRPSGYWNVEFQNPVKWTSGRVSKFGEVLDDWLRPIRDNDGEDETLAWAGKPKKVAA